MAHIGEMLSNVSKGKVDKQPSLTIRASVMVPDKSMPGFSRKYEKEEYERTKKEIKAIESALENWIPEDVAERARKSLEAELEVKKAHALECKARMKQDKSESSKIEDDEDDEDDEDEYEDDEDDEDDETESEEDE